MRPCHRVKGSQEGSADVPTLTAEGGALCRARRPGFLSDSRAQEAHDFRSTTWPGPNFFRKSRKCTTRPLRSLSESYDIPGEKICRQEGLMLFCFISELCVQLREEWTSSWRSGTLSMPPSLLALLSSLAHSISLICILLSFSFNATQNINPTKARVFVLCIAVLPEPKTGPGI